MDEIAEKRGDESVVVNELLDKLPLGMFESSADGELEYQSGLLSELLDRRENQMLEGREELKRQLRWHLRECVSSGKPMTVRLKVSDEWDLFLHAFPRKEQDGDLSGAMGWVERNTGATKLQSKLEKKINELSILCELGKSLGGTLNLEETLQIILICVTARQGLGFNRAFLLLLNQTGTLLEGKLAIGPSNSEEAKRIWDSLSAREQSLEEVLRSYRDVLKEKDVLINQVVRKLKIVLSDKRNPLVQSILNKRAYNVFKEENQKEAEFFKLLGADQFAIAPLISKDKMLGVILADNLITRRPIEDEDVKLLSISAHHAAAAIESSQLYQELAEKVSKLEEANQKIAESSKRLLKVEKLSVLGQITSQLAHELRNPMTIIGGFANSILKKKDEEDPDHEYIKIIAEETQRMEKVLNNVLNFSRPDKFHQEVVNLDKLVDQTFEMMEPEMDTTKISVVRLPSPILPSVYANPDLIRQSLLNVFRNAIWAMPQGGILTVATRQRDKWARIEIKDTGFGIPSEHLDKIFDPFFTTRPESCGLGLTISSEIIKNHGGRIDVESIEGKGATLYIELPLAASSNEQDQQNEREIQKNREERCEINT
jgi:signal transduction histidine kinase